MSQVFDPAVPARAFVDARHNDEVLGDYPGVRPESLEQAYCIQDNAIAQWPDRVAGWKLGKVPIDKVARYGAERIVGPIFASSIVTAQYAETCEVPILRGFAAVEVEILLRVDRAIGSVLTIAQAREAVDEVRLGIEVASSPFPGINDGGPAITASDFGNNYGLVLGPTLVAEDEEAVVHSLATLSIDGCQVGEGRAAEMLDGPFGSLAFLSAALAARGRHIEKGSWISTGALTGVHRIAVGSLVTARLDGFAASLSCSTVSASK